MLVVRGDRGIGQVAENGAALQAAGFADRLDPFDPAAAVVELGAALKTSLQDGVTDGALGGVIGRVYLQVGDVAEGPQRVVLLKQPGSEVRGPGVLAGGALLQQRLYLGAERSQVLGQPVVVVAVGEELVVGGDHLSRELDEPGAATATRARALGDLNELANHVTLMPNSA